MIHVNYLLGKYEIRFSSQVDFYNSMFLRGLTRSTTTEMLHQYFQNFGELTDCVVIKNPTTKLSRCFGFVQFTTPPIADHVVESRPHIIDGKEIDVKHASAESHERHQQQLAAAAAAAAAQERIRETSPDRQKKRSRWEMQQSSDSHRPFLLPHDMTTLKSNTHIAFIQRDMITYPIPLKYLREENFQQQSNDNSYYPQPSRHQHNNNRMYQT
jgi:RNA recognition motif-containing protein